MSTLCNVHNVKSYDRLTIVVEALIKIKKLYRFRFYGNSFIHIICNNCSELLFGFLYLTHKNNCFFHYCKHDYIDSFIECHVKYIFSFYYRYGIYNCGF